MGKFNGQRHNLTRQEKSKGGQSRSIIKSIIKRKKCSRNCPLFNRCPFASMGLKYNTCYLNCGEYPTLKRNVEKLFTGDKKDFFEVVSNVIGGMLCIIESGNNVDVREHKMVVDSLEKLHNMKYGMRQKSEIGGKVDIEFFRDWLDEQ